MCKFSSLPYCAVLVFLFGTNASAQSGYIAFSWGCGTQGSGGPYVMRADLTGRVALPLPAPVAAPSPSTGSVQLGMDATDVSSIGPISVLTVGGYVVQVDDINGSLVPHQPVSLVQPPAVAYGSGAFSPTGDRVALWADGSGTGFPRGITIADLVRDTSGRIIGMANATYISVANIGSPADSNASTNTSGFTATWTGQMDFSPDGSKLVFTSYSDLWLLALDTDGHTLLSATNMTRTVGTTEMNPSFSPDGTKIAYTGGVNSYVSKTGYVLRTSDQNIYTLDLTSSAYSTRLLTTTKNKGGSGDGRDYPTWSPLGTDILFSAQGRSPGRSNPCGGSGNSELFTIKADGSSPAVNITNTVGTANEGRPRWGW